MNPNQTKTMKTTIENHHPVNLFYRKSRRYVQTWDHLNGLSDVCTAYVTERRCGPRDEDGGFTEVLTIEVPETPGLRPKGIKRALEDTFSLRGCDCSHDCCGCHSQYVRNVIPVPRKPRLWRVVICNFYNL